MTDEPRPCFAAFHVDDMQASVRFYRDGIGIALEANENPPHNEISWHDPYFHFALFPKDAPPESALGLFVEDLDAAHERLVRMGATVETEPAMFPWGRGATYLDPDGNLIGLTERGTHPSKGQ